MEITGRKTEIELLAKLKRGKSSAFVVIYGRRRVGKTYLIRHAFDNHFDFSLTGMANTNTVSQLANFHISIKKYAGEQAKPEPARNWLEAFEQLIWLLERSSSAMKTVFLDELPWLDTAQSGFIPALEHFWNGWASARKDIILVVCGSAASWMINELINSKGGLHNRVTHRIALAPFTLKECKEFFSTRSAAFDNYQIVLLYMVMGGIPFYLDQVDPALSAAQNIDRLCFTNEGLLRKEFDNLYHSLFQKAERHIAIIEALSKKTKGLTRDELIKASKMPNGGGTTRILKELEESYFIRRYVSYGKKERLSLYQLCDFYSLFYLKWIKDSGTLDANTWINQLDSPRQRAWSGYAFEQVCLAHIAQIKKALGISGIESRASSWISTDKDQGAQVDLVIDRRDQVINLCEMKFSIHSFTIDKKYAEELSTKIRVFKEQTKTRKAIYLTMVTSFGLTPNSYSQTLVQNDLSMELLFE